VVRSRPCRDDGGAWFSARRGDRPEGLADPAEVVHGAAQCGSPSPVGERVIGLRSVRRTLPARDTREVRPEPGLVKRAAVS
jgi:hypothetical protein